MELDEKYIAGFFDGEGCIYASQRVDKKGYNSSTLKIQIAQCNLEVLELIQQKYGGSILEHKNKMKANWRQAWVWQVPAHKAVAFLESVLPYLVVKKEQAELALEFQGLVSSRLSPTKLTVDELLKRQILVKKIKELKKI